MRPHHGFKLHIILCLLALLSIISTLVVCAISAYQANQQSLTTSYLANNQQYAAKLSYTTRAVLQSMQNDLSVTADQLQQYTNKKEIQTQMDTLWKLRQNYFNSMLYVDDQLKVVAISSPFNDIKVGTTMSQEGFLQARKHQKPSISDPYIGATGKLLILITVPIFNQTGEYEGLLSGTIYLHEPNILYNTLSQNFYDNGSYVYVVDQTGQIIFHPNHNQVGSMAESNILKKGHSNDSGADILTNSKHQTNLTGYAFEPFTGWGIIVATPASITVDPTNELVINMIKRAFPFFLILITISAILAVRISKPLYVLARYSENITSQKGKVNTPLPQIKSSVYEIKQLYQSTKLAHEEINQHMNQLDSEIQTDALTGLANRRTFDLIINKHIEKQLSFSLIFVDIDFFKKVNDTYGHLVGDDVLRFLAEMMKNLFRDGDLCFRYGGEEFALILPYGKPDAIIALAERLRTKLEVTTSPSGEAITISLGISLYPDHGQTANEVIAAADEAMYRSKTSGRNKTTFYTKE